LYDLAPPPGVPKDRQLLVQELQRELEITPEEAQLYVSALVEGRCAPADAPTRRTAASLSARGMLIQEGSGDGSSYLAVHPRLALSNLFRAYEDRLVRQRKEKRLSVDRLTLDLILLLPGESKGTNPTGPGGGKAKDE
jgi:hypothetical protein